MQISDSQLKTFINQVRCEAPKAVKEWYSNSHNRFLRYEYASCLMYGNKVVSASFCHTYGTWLRIGQLHYTLKAFRRECPSAMLRNEGFLDHHLKENRNLHQGIFFTIHTYDKRMQIQSDMMHKRLINHYGYELTKNRDRIVFCGKHVFHNVNQDIFVLPHKELDKDKFLNEILAFQ